MEKEKIAPWIQRHINYLNRISDRWNSHNEVVYDEETYFILDRLFDLLQQLEPVNEYGTHILWFSAHRGSIEDFGDYDEMLKDGTVENREEFKQLWEYYYPDETEWYGLSAREDNGYRIVTLAQQTIFMVSPNRNKDDFPHKVSEFAQWLFEKVESCVEELKAGTYAARIQRELPLQHRKGIILRKDYWDIFPDRRAEFFENLSSHEVEEFLSYINDQSQDEKEPNERRKEFTANEFFRCCSLCYLVNGYKNTDLSPREQYYKNADGRDDGLGEIDPDSSEAFHDWLHHRTRIGGHPWEICRGGNSTHIALYVIEDEKGYYLRLAGSATSRTVETVKFYLALRRAGIPVALYDANIMAQRMTETEKIGIVPQGILPVYCHSLFPGENIKTFLNLPSEKRDLMAQYCVWYDVEISKLKENVELPEQKG